MIDQKEIIEYYDKSKVSYRDVWHMDTCMALHYGFWEKGVYSLKRALIRENEVLAKMIAIKSTDVILDAGCGVGGSSIFLASEFDCQVHGITLSQDQVSIATKAAENRGLSKSVSFSVADYHNTPFESNSFDVIWFMESFCHSNDPEGLLKEMYRVLKPDGRLIIADAFLTKEDHTEEESLLIKKWLNNWAIDIVSDLPVLTKALSVTDFQNVKTSDYSKQVARSAYLLYFYAVLALGYGKFLGLLGKTYGDKVTVKNTIGAKFQYLAFRKDLWRYYVISASKPKL